MTGAWFKPKTYGYGATPANWKGWAATAAFVVALILLSLLMLVMQPDGATGPAAWQIAAWAVVVAVLTVGFVRLARSKTDGQWAWRWGK